MCLSFYGVKKKRYLLSNENENEKERLKSMPKNWKCCQVCGEAKELQNVSIWKENDKKEEYTFCKRCTNSAKQSFKRNVVQIEEQVS